MSGSESLAVPEIIRARGYRLYDTLGNRLLDLHQNGGHAILGHRAYKLTTTLKNVISRGQIFDLPSVHTRRLLRAVSQLLPGYPSLRVYANRERLLDAAGSYLGRSLTDGELWDPALCAQPLPSPEIAFWRPFLESEAVNRQIPLVVPILPFSVLGGPQVLCFKTAVADNFCPSDTISPFVLAGTTRAVYDLKKYQEPAWLVDRKKIEVYWRLRGIYLSPRFEASVYGEVFRDFLAGGILLSPTYPGPSCLPREVSPGEADNLRLLLEKCPLKAQ